MIRGQVSNTLDQLTALQVIRMKCHWYADLSPMTLAKVTINHSSWDPLELVPGIDHFADCINGLSSKVTKQRQYATSVLRGEISLLEAPLQTA